MSSSSEATVCETCGAAAVHREPFEGRVPGGCEACVPWSGHHAFCGPRCDIVPDATSAPNPRLRAAFRALCAAVAERPAMFGITPECAESVLCGAWYMVTGTFETWPDALARCGLLRGNRSGVRTFEDVARLARALGAEGS